MRKHVYIVEEISKPADEVLKTARIWGDGFDNSPSDVYGVSFKRAFTQTEIRDQLRDLVSQVNEETGKKTLKLKDCKVIRGEFIELDSLNMSHAGAYYFMLVRIPREAAELTEMEFWNTQKEFERA